MYHMEREFGQEKGASMDYFTSDLHFGSVDVAQLSNRPFDSILDMNECIIRNWNERVKPDDKVYIIGDFMNRAETNPEHYLSQLPGRKHLIIGNHDHGWTQRIDVDEWFEAVEYMTEILSGGHLITLCHYPLMEWHGGRHGAFLIHGHLHDRRDAPFWPLLQRYKTALNAGVDINGFAPVTFGELVENNRRWKQMD